MGIRRPGFQLLSVATPNPNSGTSSRWTPDILADVPCLLPDQIKIYTHGYAPLGLLTVFLLFYLNHQSRRRRQSDTEWMEETTEPYAFSSSGSSEPSTYAKLRHSPEHSLSLAQSTLVNNSNGQRGDEENPDLSSIPLADSYTKPPGSDDMYPLPVHRQYPPHPRSTRTSRRRALDTPFSGGSRLFAFLGPAQTCCMWWRAVCGRTWYSRAVKDLCDVAWPPLSVYIMISVWLFWR